ncbi:MAG: LamB/YcsF family protein, partial [Paracoccaceae bacterium]|nr:LamB/YcsF family protein [Paracoccaceae bacterium]
IKARIDTICLHGDTPNALKIAKSVRRSLEQAGVTLAKFCL